MTSVPPGISALLVAANGRPLAEEVVLDVAAVLDGLVGTNFEIVVLAATPDPLPLLQERYPNLPLRICEADLSTAIETTVYDLVFVLDVASALDVCDLSHFLEAIESGADLAIGYRPRTFERLAWSALGTLLFGKTARDVDCPFKLFRRAVWQGTAMGHSEQDGWFNTRLVVRARRLGFRIAELPVRRAQLNIDAAATLEAPSDGEKVTTRVA